MTSYHEQPRQDTASRNATRLVAALTLGCLSTFFMTDARTEPAPSNPALEDRIADLLSRMTLEEKIGQMNLVNSPGPSAVDQLGDSIRAGRIGALLNEVDVERVDELQRIAVEESRLGIPLMFARDVIHGFATVMPIPLGQAATWNPDIVEAAARVAAREAAGAGINWTFAPMMDLTRDPRWGRIAEGFGEDALLASAMATAMVQGFQGEDLAAPGSLAACAKHFAAYGAVESGRDYATTDVSEHALRNYHFHPFRAAVDAGVSTVMASFTDLNGVPATGNSFLMREVLRDEWGFDGFVVSDWDSVRQLAVHGFTADDRDSARAAALAGIDMEMVGGSYAAHLAALVEDGVVAGTLLDASVANILRTKFRLGLFDDPQPDRSMLPAPGSPDALATARASALQSVVLLKNDNNVLPFSRARLQSLAVIGPLADAPYEQLGTWVFDGDRELSVTPLQALRDLAGDDLQIRYVRALQTSRSRPDGSFSEAVDAAKKSDAVVLVLGEESILSGEAHSRADIGLPGDQARLVREVRATGKPLVAVVMAGRPLTLTDVADEVDALLYAWHPGSMGGPAIADLLFGVESPSGKLPVTFPRMVGQIPIYYNQKNTGRPPTPDTTIHIDDIEQHAPQTSLGMTAFHLDAGYEPLYVFGHGLSYTSFAYDNLRVEPDRIRRGESLRVLVDLTNTGERAGTEVAQLYVRDLVGSVTRPVRELKGFRRVSVEPGKTVTVAFDLPAEALAFYDRHMERVVEPGRFLVFVGGSSEAELHAEFSVVE